MGCGCGGQVAVLVNGFNVDGEPYVETNERGMYLLAGDDPDCEPYHGLYQGSTLFLACAGTEWAATFEVTQLMAAKEYAAEHHCGVQRESVLSFCHARMIAHYGA